MKFKLLLLLLLSTTSQLFSQSRYVADMYFKNFAYPKAAELYESIYKKGDSSKYIIKRIADSYYNNAKTKESEYWYLKLINKYEVTDDVLFRYAQSLRSNNNYVKSDSLLSIVDKKSLKEINRKTSFLFKEDKDSRIKVNLNNVETNTQFSDFGAFLYKDELYFASTSPKNSKQKEIYYWNNQPYLNIYKAELTTKSDSTLDLSKKEVLSGPVNTRYHESNPIFTKDGETMYFTRVNYVNNNLKEDKNQTVNLKLLRAKLIDGKWADIVELPFNSDEYSVGHPSLSFDEKTLYFISDMPGSIGETDIYKVAINNNDTYGEPENLGEIINTPDKEMFPYITEENTLYFSSDGHIGFGLLDIFQSKIKADGTFEKPKNLRAPFNSKRDDFAFLIDKSKTKGFLSSNRQNGKGDDDIYSFIITEEPKEICTQIITGVVKDSKTQEPIDNAVVKIFDSEGVIIKQVLSKEGGLYEFTQIDCNKDYTIQGSKKDYKADQKTVKTTLVSGNEIKTELLLTPLIIDNQIVISPIYFDFDKSNIREEAQYELENIVTVMNNHPDMIIKIESHTDSRATKLYNRRLSDRRAKSTKKYILSRGIAPNRIISAIGYGEEQLLNDCDDANMFKCTEEEHQLNRRSYFIIVKGGEGVKVDNKKPTVIDPKPNR